MSAYCVEDVEGGQVGDKEFVGEESVGRVQVVRYESPFAIRVCGA